MAIFVPLNFIRFSLLDFTSDALIDYLTEYRAKINSERYSINSADTRKVENMYNYIINDIDLDIISSSNRQGAKVRGEGETLSQRTKRSIKNF